MNIRMTNGVLDYVFSVTTRIIKGVKEASDSFVVDGVNNDSNLFEKKSNTEKGKK